MPFEILRRFDPFVGMNELGSRVSQLFGATSARRAEAPPMDIWEDEHAYHLEVELPGLKQEEVEVLVRESEVTLRGERKPAADDNRTWHHRERTWGKFERAVTLPVAVAADKVEARFVDGVLHVKLPKSESAKPRKIEVKAG